MFPQPDRFAVMWMPRRQLERAAGLDGAFNDLVLRTGPGTDAAQLTRTIEALTDRYGGQRAQTRERIPSARFLDQELDQLATMSTILPPAFLAVAAFLLNVSLTRLVEAERSNIGLMKAFGFHAREVATGYLAMALVLTVAGVLAGYALGLWLGNAMAGIYLSVYRLPSLPFTPGADALALGAGTALLAGLAGSLVAVRRVLALAPAVALAPPPPPAFQRGPALGEHVVRRLDALTRVVLRRIIGFPRRSLTTVLGLTAALSLLMLAQVANLATDRLLDLTFEKAKRQDVSLTLVEPGGVDALHALSRLPGVLGAEPFRMVEGVFSGPGGEADEALVGLPAVAAYDRLVGLDGTAVALRDDGLVLTAGLARKLGVGAGDVVRVAPVRGERRPFVLRVAAVEVVTVGNSAYLEIGAMGRLLGEPGRIDGAHLRIDPAQYEAFNQAVREAPRVVGVSYVGLARASMEKIFAEGQGTMSTIFLSFAVLMVVGIAYATASVTLAEQRRDLATLQVLGYSRREASYVLVAELAVLALIAMPVGLVFGHWFSVSFLDAMATDLFTFPHTIDPAAYARAPAIVLGAVAAAVLLVRRDVDRINLVESLKSRE
jgi:putative ABC transport system permease protein